MLFRDLSVFKFNAEADGHLMWAAILCQSARGNKEGGQCYWTPTLQRTAFMLIKEL